MMVDFTQPWAFALLPLALFVPALAWWRRRRRAIDFSSLDAVADVPTSWRERMAWLPDLLRVLAAIGLVVALARPQLERTETSLERDGIAIEMLVDISSSMDMKMDYRGEDATRLDVAKDVLEQFVLGDGDKLQGRSDDLIGIITFARYADTVCPLTLSHDAVAYFASILTINDRPNEDGTAYGDATALAAARLSTLEEALWQGEAGTTRTPEVKSKIIVLLTDGENNCGRHLPLQAAALAKEWGIRVYTISLTDAGKPRRLKDGDETIEVASGRSAAEQVLEQMATSTGGIYRTAHDFDSLRSVYSEIDELERSQLRSMAKKVRTELFTPFAIAALLALLAEVVLRNTVLRIDT